MPSILFVCTANQVRSPMAAALFVALLSPDQAANWRVESAGTWTEEGLPASKDAQRLMRERGLDISRHRTRCVNGEMLRGFDLILVMEQNHKEALLVEFPTLAARMHLVSEMAGGAWDIRDPVYESANDMEETAGLLHALLVRGREWIAQLVHGSTGA